jgi:hypothetical protein
VVPLLPLSSRGSPLLLPVEDVELEQATAARAARDTPMSVTIARRMDAS